MKRFIYSLLLIPALISSCKSVDNGGISQFSEAPLFGMIYNSESFPVDGALVVLDNDKSAQTDINGRILFSSVSRGKHSVVISKEGFEEVSIELNFVDRNQVLYSTLISYQNILDKLASSLKAGRITEAKAFLKRALEINSETMRFKYLNIVYLSGIKEYAKALEEITSLSKTYPDDPYIIMTRAKILYYGLKRREEAIELLQNFHLPGKNKELLDLVKKMISKINDEKMGEETPGDDNEKK